MESAFDFDLAALGLTLTLIGDAPVSGRGNDAGNTLDGSQNAAANTLIGGRGDDRYVLGAGDVAIEQSGEGRDTVQIVSGPAGEYRLGDHVNVEALELGELLGASWLVGTAGDDALTGNRFANRLDGGAGADTLTGGDGGDTYVTGRALGRRHEVARIVEDRLAEDDRSGCTSRPGTRWFGRAAGRPADAGARRQRSRARAGAARSDRPGGRSPVRVGAGGELLRRRALPGRDGAVR